MNRLDLQANWTVNELIPEIRRLEDEVERLANKCNVLQSRYNSFEEVHMIPEERLFKVIESLKAQLAEFEPGLADEQRDNE